MRPCSTRWADQAGARIPTTRITGYALESAHCGYHNNWALSLKLSTHADFVRDPDGNLPGGAVTYDGDVELPAQATDSGFRHGATRLWLTGDSAYLVGPDHVERWPKVPLSLRCG